MSEDDEEGTDVEHILYMDEEENSEPNVPDPYDRVYANAPLESHMLPSVLNYEHCNIKKFEGKPPDSIVGVERFIFQLLRHHQSS